jgi:hypothetical protein
MASAWLASTSSIGFPTSACTSRRKPGDLLMYRVATYWYGKPCATHNRPPLPAEAARPITSFEDLSARSSMLRGGGASLTPRLKTIRPTHSGPPTLR